MKVTATAVAVVHAVVVAVTVGRVIVVVGTVVVMGVWLAGKDVAVAEE